MNAKENNEKKYELVNEMWRMEIGVRHHRIRALKDFGDVKAGDLGGWVESEANLSQDGDCWIYDGALVAGNSRVFENAKIYGGTMLLDDVKVHQSASIHGGLLFGSIEVIGTGSISDILDDFSI